MKQVSPHRKRRANKGRLHTAVVVAYDHQMVGGTRIGKSVVMKPESSHSAVDAVMLDGYGEFGSHHRNRFNADHKVVLTAPNLSNARFVVRLMRIALPKVDIDEVLCPGGIISLTIHTDAIAVVDFLSSPTIPKNYSKHFTVTEAFCGENKSPMANTMRKLHGRSY